MPPGTKIRLNIRNLVRAKSLYNDGMLPRICYYYHPAAVTSKDAYKKDWHHDPNVTSELKFSETDTQINFDSE